MGHDALKLELIEWLSRLDDAETIDYLKLVKDSKASKKDWWHDLTHEQKAGIDRGLKDVDAGRITPHEKVRQKYGF